MDTLPASKIVDYEAPQTYEIGGIKVKGAVWADKAVLLSIAGLRIGDKLEIPSVKTAQALKAIWKLGLFSDVQIYQEKTVGEIVYLVLQVVEINRLGGIDLKGVKKSKITTINNIILQHLTCLLYTSDAADE